MREKAGGRCKRLERGAWRRIRRQDNQIRDNQSTKKVAAPGDSKQEHNMRRQDRVEGS
jgi:hypothetical protein